MGTLTVATTPFKKMSLSCSNCHYIHSLREGWGPMSTSLSMTGCWQAQSCASNGKGCELNSVRAMGSRCLRQPLPLPLPSAFRFFALPYCLSLQGGAVGEPSFSSLTRCDFPHLFWPLQEVSLSKADSSSNLQTGRLS